MGEAIITSRYGQLAEGGSSDIMQLPNYTSLVISVKDSANKRVEYAGVQVTYPNNSTYTGWCNKKGQGLFFIPSNISKINITALNRFKDDSITGFLADQNTVYLNNIQTNIGGIVYANCQLSYKSTGSICTMSGNYKFLNTNYADVYIIGGGGGGMASAVEKGGGGGGLSVIKNISINKSEIYNFIIGNGGSSGWSANAGGTSSAFGISANGGSGGGASNGANGGIGMYNGGQGGYRNMSNQDLNYSGANSNYINILLGIGSVIDNINCGINDPNSEYNQTWTRYVNFVNIGHGGYAGGGYNDYRGTIYKYSLGSGGKGAGTSFSGSSSGVDGVIFLANFR